MVSVSLDALIQSKTGYKIKLKIIRYKHKPFCNPFYDASQKHCDRMVAFVNTNCLTMSAFLACQ